MSQTVEPGAEIGHSASLASFQVPRTVDGQPGAEKDHSASPASSRESQIVDEEPGAEKGFLRIITV